MKVIDFTDVNIYPKNYWCNQKNGSRRFKIRTLVIENIKTQLNVLMTKQTQLMLGDAIKVRTKFGHNIATKKAPENWIDVSIDSCFKVTSIVPLTETNEILLKVKELNNVNNDSESEYSYQI